MVERFLFFITVGHLLERECGLVQLLCALRGVEGLAEQTQVRVWLQARQLFFVSNLDFA